ncbi:MAG: AAA family ATPase [Gemmatimonadota bacterium]|nr:AAA family ATPase [Gemmatimonadota bacterium]
MGLRKAGGNWVAGDRFFDREVEVDALIERVEDGTHTLVTAQRRMGKTSLVRELLRRLEERGDFETVFVDLEDCSTAADAVVEIAAASRHIRGIWARLKSWAARSTTSAVDRIDELGASELRIKLRAAIDAGRWRAQGDALFASLAASEKPVVLAIDELPILVNRLLKGHEYTITPERRQDTDAFLSWLRKNAQAHRDCIRLVVSGSVGLEPILEQAELSAHANVFAPFELRPWNEETAVACLGELAASYGLEIPEGVRTGMFRRLRCGIPHHVQQFFDWLHEHLRRDNRCEASMDDVDTVYSQDMLGVRGQVYLEHYQSRLRMVLGDDGYVVALELLTEAAVSGGQLTDGAIRQYEDYRSVLAEEARGQIRGVLHVLEHDGYLARRDGGYNFVSGLVEDWWRARNARGFVPFSDRHA